MAKRWDVCSPRAGKEKTFWHRVGTAFEGQKGINIVFDSLPLPDTEGRVSVSLFEPRDSAQARSGGSGNGGNARQAPRGFDADMDDAVPFIRHGDAFAR